MPVVSSPDCTETRFQVQVLCNRLALTEQNIYASLKTWKCTTKTTTKKNVKITFMISYRLIIWSNKWHGNIKLRF